jgi:hypothetical protein
MSIFGFGRRSSPTPYVPPVPPIVSGPRVIRVTNASDGALVPRMYSFWSNAIVIGRAVIVFVGHADGHPRFFNVDLASGQVTRLGSLVDYVGTSEGWRWSQDSWLYLTDGPRLRRVDPFMPDSDEIVFDISIIRPGCDIFQTHSDDSGRVHSATVRRIVPEGAYPYVATVLVTDGVPQFFEASDTGPIDESQIDPTGRWLLIKIAPEDDNLVYDTATKTFHRLLKAEGAVGHSDMGPGYIIGADRDHEPRACVRWNLPLTTASARILLAQSSDWSGGDLGHVSVKNGVCLISDTEAIWRVDVDGGGKTKLIDHGMTGPADYDHEMQANLSPDGRVAAFLSNHGTDRFDLDLLIL